MAQNQILSNSLICLSLLEVGQCCSFLFRRKPSFEDLHFLLLLLLLLSSFTMAQNSQDRAAGQVCRGNNFHRKVSRVIQSKCRKGLSYYNLTAALVEFQCNSWVIHCAHNL